MPSGPRKQFTPGFKAKVAIEAIKGERTATEIARTFSVHPNLVGIWKRQALEGLPEVFATPRQHRKGEEDAEKDELYRKIGQLKVELDWIKKNLDSPVSERRQWIESDHPNLSVARQCQLTGLARSSYYYSPLFESEQNLLLLRLLDEHYTRCPYYGSRRMVAMLKRDVAFGVNRKRIQRLMRVLGLAAIHPGRNLSRPGPGHEIYPYLLRGVAIHSVNHVWSSDITYVRMQDGFAYLAAVIDWFSRFVLSWATSNTADAWLCREVLDSALVHYPQPQIFNTDQGSQFTSQLFLGPLKERGIRISMDGRGRALDNAFIERLWRTVKYEHIFLHDYASLGALRQGLETFFHHYNFVRPHQALRYRTPAEVFFQANRKQGK